MFDLTKEDHAKIVAAVSEILACGNETTDKVFVNFLDLCAVLGANGVTQRKLLHAEMLDILNGAEIVRKYGTWIMHEFDDGEYLFVRLFGVAREGTMQHHILYNGCSALSHQKGWPNFARKRNTKTLANVHYSATLLDPEHE